ncbi:hypothetical protein BGW41_005800, partial [Actinomortierella wolfii]
FLSSKNGSSVNSSTTSVNTIGSSKNYPQPQQQYYHQQQYHNNGAIPPGSQGGRRDVSYDEYMAGYDDLGRRSRVSSHSSHSVASSSGGYQSPTFSRSPPLGPSQPLPPPPPQQQRHHQQQQQQTPPYMHLLGNNNNSKTKTGVFLVGATYLDTIMHVDSYLPEDSKKRAQALEQRRGGNAANSAEVLGQDPRAKVWFMSSMPSPSASK